MFNPQCMHSEIQNGVGKGGRKGEGEQSKGTLTFLSFMAVELGLCEMLLKCKCHNGKQAKRIPHISFETSTYYIFIEYF